MKAAEFLHSIESDPQPDSTLCVELQALWWVKKGDWERAHDLAQDAGSMEGDWIHAHLHRVEGDFREMLPTGTLVLGSLSADKSYPQNGKI